MRWSIGRAGLAWRIVAGLLAFAGTTALALEAHARAGGIAASGCNGCHGGSSGGSLALVANPSVFAPGATVEMTLSLSGGFANGGVFISSANVGELQALNNQGLTKLTSGLVHNQPKPGSGGTVQFRFAWVAPSTPGAVRFSVYALGGDGNGRSSGDRSVDDDFDWVYGCNGKTFYLDGDGDGVGRNDVELLGCENSPPANYADSTGDCDDYRVTTFPDAPELCNQRDDDCDELIDEQAIPVELWPDADGDGYYDARTEKVGEPEIGCVGLKGWAAEAGDCRPEDATIHSGAKEVCNNIDDDCDGDFDERVRPACGEGWCRREAPGCDLQYCTPGAPVKEKCNFLDDDCDGLTDEDLDMCPEGLSCAAGTCVDSGSVVLVDNPPPGAGGMSPGAGPGTGPSAAGKPPASNRSADEGSGSSCALGSPGRTKPGAFGLSGLLGVLWGLRLGRRRRRRS